MVKTKMGVLAACCALSFGCGDATETEQQASPVGANGGSNGGAAGTSNGAGSTAGTNTTGGSNISTNGGGNNNAGPTGGISEDDASVPTPGPGDCTDDPTTVGNDCTGLVTCTAAVDACSLSTQNCCVREYKADAASCNEGTACEAPAASAACDGPEDCSAGQTCCISITPTGISTANINHRCVADATQCTGGIFNSILCHTADDCAEGKDCLPIGNLPFWGSCK